MLRIMVAVLLVSAVANADDAPRLPPASAAAARPVPHGFVAVGASLGGDAYLNASGVLEAGVALPDIMPGGAQLWLHAIASLGRSITGLPEFPVIGKYRRAVGGLELRTGSFGAGARGFVDLDLGYQSRDMGDSTRWYAQTAHGLWIGSRLGLEAIAPSGLQFRVAFELYPDKRPYQTSSGTMSAWDHGEALVGTLGFQL